MQFDARLTGDAATLARAHEEVLGRLPATVRAFVLVELQKWPALFGPEQRYQRALLGHLSRLPTPELQRAVAGIARVENEAGVSKLARRRPRDAFRTTRRRCCERAGSCRRGGRKSTASFSRSTRRSMQSSTPRMRRAGWWSRSTAAASPSRPTSCGAASKGQASAYRSRSRARQDPTRFSAGCLAGARAARRRRRCLPRPASRRASVRWTPGSSNPTRRCTNCATAALRAGRPRSR